MLKRFVSDQSRIGAVILVLIAISGGRLQAQKLSLSGTIGHSTHEDIGQSVGVTASMVFGPVAFHMLAVSGSLDRFDTPCGGFVPPNGCEAENIQVRHSIRALDAGVSLLFARYRLVAAYIAPYVSAGMGEVAKYRSDGSRSARDSAPLLGAGLSISAEASPAVASRLGFVLALSARRWLPFQFDEVDAYQPLNSFYSAGASLGASVTF